MDKEAQTMTDNIASGVLAWRRSGGKGPLLDRYLSAHEFDPRNSWHDCMMAWCHFCNGRKTSVTFRNYIYTVECEDVVVKDESFRLALCACMEKTVNPTGGSTDK